MRFLNFQVQAQNGLARVDEAVKDERGEIGSQLILMAVLVAAAVAAVAAFREPLGDLISGIGDDLGSDTDV